ncbi:fimbrial protein [Ewingella americana]|uniref:fimbrial protein n=1 Tax=Ewingella americana TaxID=41202 RepID=UPI0012ADF0E8|nr:fimbrial protein [Ewingella americana]MRT03438.1 fimbrial protein [Ewingella americana]
MNNLKRSLLICLAGFPLLLLTKHVKAECTLGSEVTAPLTRSISFGHVVVQRDTPVGAEIATTTTGAFNDGHIVYGCNTPWNRNADLVLFTTLSGYGNKVYDTNIPGVGIQIQGSWTTSVFPFTTDYSKNIYLTSPDPGFTVRLIKTSAGAVGAGMLTTGTLSKDYIVGYPNLVMTIILSGSNTITPVACSVNNTVINVSLDDAVVVDFNGIGSTAKPKDFNIGLNCDAGTKVKLTLDGNAAGPAGVLALNAGTTQAEGIGIQLLKGTTPVALGSPLDFGTADTAGNMQLPLIARYYQTEAPIISGTANTTATFTLAYN